MRGGGSPGARRARGTHSTLKPLEETSHAHTQNWKGMYGFKPLLCGNLLGTPRKLTALPGLQHFLSSPHSTCCSGPCPVPCESLHSPSPLASFTFPTSHFLHWSSHSQNINAEAYCSSLMCNLPFLSSVSSLSSFLMEEQHGMSDFSNT